ncbi:MAG: Smr/MutS family protein [bacterium]
MAESHDRDPEKDDPGEDENVPEYVHVTDVLDLHGFFPEQIPEVIEAFIDNALSLRLSELSIIHGKGKSKLKYLVRRELSGNPHVVEFRDAPPELGGWGRTVVVLKEPE